MAYAVYDADERLRFQRHMQLAARGCRCCRRRRVRLYFSLIRRRRDAALLLLLFTSADERRHTLAWLHAASPAAAEAPYY